MEEASPAAINERRRVVRAARNRASQLDVPAFGDWEFLHHDCIPITQYFDFRHSPTPRASVYPYPAAYFTPADALFLHYDDFHGLQQQHYRTSSFPTHTLEPAVNWERGGQPQVKRECGTRRRRKRLNQRRSGLENKNRVFDFDTTETLTETQRSHTPSTNRSNDAVCYQTAKSKSNIKAKDEDLYKIPPELLRNSKPKRKMSKLLSKCFVTICASY